MPYKVGNIVRRGEIACYRQFLLFSQFLFHTYLSLVSQNVAMCGNGLKLDECTSNKYFY